MQRIIQHLHGPGEDGISLLEILMAIPLLGISFASIFSGLSAALRSTDHLGRIEQGSDFAARKLSELVLDPSLVPGEVRSGVSPSGLAWEATTHLVHTRPLSDSDKPAQLVRINLEVSLGGRVRAGKV